MKKSSKILWLFIAIIAVFIASQPIGNKLDTIVTARDKRVLLQNCDDEIGKNENTHYGLGSCEYLLTQKGWPFAVEKQFKFIKIEHPNKEWNFDVDNNDPSQYVEIQNQLSDEGPCNSKECLLKSNNHILVFGIMALVVTATLLYLNTRTNRKKK